MVDETVLRKEIQSEVARQLRAYGPTGVWVWVFWVRVVCVCVGVLGWGWWD
jgi:hypothetical protein